MARANLARAAAPFAAALLLLPSVAWGCPVCGVGKPETEGALLVMSAILSLLPLLMAFGIGAWIVTRARAASSRPPEPVDAVQSAGPGREPSPRPR